LAERVACDVGYGAPARLDQVIFDPAVVHQSRELERSPHVPLTSHDLASEDPPSQRLI
jgi:hypothetical protein